MLFICVFLYKIKGIYIYFRFVYVEYRNVKKTYQFFRA